jgi:hypothetical protein
VRLLQYNIRDTQSCEDGQIVNRMQVHNLMDSSFRLTLGYHQLVTCEEKEAHIHFLAAHNNS